MILFRSVYLHNCIIYIFNIISIIALCDFGHLFAQTSSIGYHVTAPQSSGCVHGLSLMAGKSSVFRPRPKLETVP